MHRLKYLLLPLMAIQSLPSYARAGFADRFQEHQHWIFPAYAYCLSFGLLLLAMLFIASVRWKDRVNTLFGDASSILVKRPFLAIFVSGLLASVPLTILADLMWEILWIVGALSVIGLIGALPVFLIDKRTRESYLLSPAHLKWFTMIALASVGASILFIVLTNCGLLPGTDITYIAPPSRLNWDALLKTHPWDSIKEIWLLYPLFAFGVLLALFITGLSMVVKRLLRALRHERHATSYSKK